MLLLMVILVLVLAVGGVPAGSGISVVPAAYATAAVEDPATVDVSVILFCLLLFAYLLVLLPSL